MVLMFLSELLSVVIFNHGAESQRDKCVSDYVVNYEMEILRISLNFSTKVSLFSTWQRTDPSIFLLNSHTRFTFFFFYPHSAFRLSGFLFVLL